MLLVDANVLLYAVNERSAYHEEARSWLDDALAGSTTIGFAWTVLLAFVRLTTHPSVFPRPLAPADALTVVRQWLDRPTAVVVAPSDRHLDLLAGLLGETGTGGNLTSDAHLAALALEHRAELVSYDGDLARFPGVRLRTPGGKRRRG